MGGCNPSPCFCASQSQKPVISWLFSRIAERGITRPAGNSHQHFRHRKLCGPNIFNPTFMRRQATFLITAFFCAICLAAGAARMLRKPTPTPTPEPDDNGQTKIFEVRLPVTVTQKKKLVTGLSKDDFVSLRRWRPAGSHVFLRRKDQSACLVGVLMDTSPSTAGKLGFSKEAAKNFLIHGRAAAKR